jgi:hypothetical protein
MSHPRYWKQFFKDQFDFYFFSREETKADFHLQSSRNPLISGGKS